MIIWSGFGFFGIVIIFGVSFITQAIIDGYFGKGYYSNNQWAYGLALVIGGILTFIIGYVLKNRSDKVLIDPVTQQQVVINQSNHTIFFIPLYIFGLITSVVGLLLIILNALTLG